MNFFSVLTLIGGLSLFLYGMNVMGDALKQLSGYKLESILARLTSNRFKGFFLGLIVTSLVQSSSATTVMLVGFVNSGIMKLGQTISIIMGANVGTTVTAWILSLTSLKGESFFLQLFKPTSFTPILAAIGIIMTMTGKSDRKKNIGTILIGFAILMFGMNTMSDSMIGLRESAYFEQTLTMFSNPFMGIVSGTVLTALIQSSSASVGILQAISSTGIMPYSTAIPIIFGQNIGAAVAPLLSAINGHTDAKRVALACLYIKLIGVMAVCIIFYSLNAVIHFTFLSYPVNAISIAAIHTLFNIISTVILIPFCQWIENLTVRTLRGKSNDAAEVFHTLDERFLSMPSFAVEKCRLIVSDMAKISEKSFDDATKLIFEYNSDADSEINEKEDEVDIYEDKTSSYLLKISERTLSQSDSREVSQLLHVVGDVERISDHAVNIVEVAREIHDKKINFSDVASNEINVITNAVREILSIAVRALVEEDLNLAKQVEPLEQIIDKLKYNIKNNHIKRLREGECTVELGFILSDILTNYERVADHCSNIAVCLLEIDNNSFETHEYLSHVKKDGENEFFELYNMYKTRYSI